MQRFLEGVEITNEYIRFGLFRDVRKKDRVGRRTRAHILVQRGPQVTHRQQYRL